MSAPPRRATREDFLTLPEVEERLASACAKLARVDAAIEQPTAEYASLSRGDLEELRGDLRVFIALLGNMVIIPPEKRAN